MFTGLLLLILSVAYTQCIPSTGMEDILRGKEHHVCITLNGSERSVFHPKVDEYGRYTYSHCILSLPINHDVVYEKVITNTTSPVFVQISVSSYDKSGENIVTANSVPKLYTGLSHSNHFFTYMTAVINVEKGVVKSISWDDGCLTCFASGCGQNSVITTDGKPQLISESDTRYKAYRGNNCFQVSSDCTKDKNCDLTIFLVWEGSDKKGRVFQSSNLRLSRFQSGSLESAINAL